MADTNFIFIRECDIPKDAKELLIDDEYAIAAYATVRDSAIFTNKRIIIRDSQGITGFKVEIYTIPYSSIHMWSSENAGVLDSTAELELWVRNEKIKINLKKGIDIRKLDRLIAEVVL